MPRANRVLFRDVLRNMVPAQFSLRFVFVVVTICSVVCALFVRFGFAGIALAGIALGAATLWAYLYNLAPEATKYFTVFAVIGLHLFSLLSVGLLRARDNSRGETSAHHLCQLGCQSQQQAELHPNAAISQLVSAALRRPPTSHLPGT